MDLIFYFDNEHQASKNNEKKWKLHLGLIGVCDYSSI